MGNIKSSIKYAIFSKKRKKINSSKRSIIKTFLKKVIFFIEKGDKEQAYKYFLVLQPILDRFSAKNIIHFNKSSRYKSMIMSKINKML